MLVINHKFACGDLVTFAGFLPDVPRQRFRVESINVDAQYGRVAVAYWLRVFDEKIRWEVRQYIMLGEHTRAGYVIAGEEELIPFSEPTPPTA